MSFIATNGNSPGKTFSTTPTAKASGPPRERVRSYHDGRLGDGGGSSRAGRGRRPSTTTKRRAAAPAARSTAGPNVRLLSVNRLESRSAKTITTPMTTVVSSEPARKNDSSRTGRGLTSATSTTASSAGQTIEASASRKTSASCTYAIGTVDRLGDGTRTRATDPASHVASRLNAQTHRGLS